MFFFPQQHSHIPLFLMTPLQMMINAAFVFTQLYGSSVYAVIVFPLNLFFFDLCMFALPPHWACVFVCLCSQKGLKNVFDEAILAALEPPEPKKKRKCVLLWEAPPFSNCTHITHTLILNTHTHAPPAPHPFPCSAKAGWQSCPPQGRLARKQPTKFQIILCNNKKLHPKCEFGTEDEPNLANRVLWAPGRVALLRTGIQIPSLLTSRIQVCRAFDRLIFNSVNVVA